jgi:hypothetical protein
MTTVFLAPYPVSRVWRSAQLAALVLTVALLAALVARPVPTLHVLWNMVIPILPAVFLINPMLWRNVCPLATLNSGGDHRRSWRGLDSKSIRVAWGAGVLLLFALVPARRFLLNTNGAALAMTIAVVAVLALVAGSLYTRRSAFCNTLCPVLPVEKLYGQSPLVQISTARCAACTVCSPIGCIDLSAGKTVAQTVGPKRQSRQWLLTSFGIFAAAFPGFVVAYFTLADGDLSSAAQVYAHIAEYAFVSYVIVAGVVLASNVKSSLLIPLLGATAFMLYYWFAAPAIASAYGAPDIGQTLVRAAAAVLVSIWLWRFWRRGQHPIMRPP